MLRRKQLLQNQSETQNHSFFIQIDKLELARDKRHVFTSYKPSF